VRLIFYPCIEIFLRFFEKSDITSCFCWSFICVQTKLPGAAAADATFDFHAQKCRQIIVNGHSYQWQVDTYHAHQRNQEWRHYIASSDFESGRPITKSLVDLDDNRPSESGQWASLIWNWEEGKKTPRTPALNRERITTFWQQWKRKTWRTQQFCSNWAIRIQWSFVCYPLEGGFFTELQVHLTV